MLHCSRHVRAVAHPLLRSVGERLHFIERAADVEQASVVRRKSREMPPDVIIRIRRNLLVCARGVAEVMIAAPDGTVIIRLSDALVNDGVDSGFHAAPSYLRIWSRCTFSPRCRCPRCTFRFIRPESINHALRPGAVCQRRGVVRGVPASEEGEVRGL